MFVNAEIIRQGYGFALTRYPFKEEFSRLEREARQERGDCGTPVLCVDHTCTSHWRGIRGLASKQPDICTAGCLWQRLWIRRSSRQCLPETSIDMRRLEMLSEHLHFVLPSTRCHPLTGLGYPAGMLVVPKGFSQLGDCLVA